ncbi:TetR/AcrR family transcriptional regulator [Demequina sp. NBRC 110053]|uniref:TetR/AcrR family transcriptional regulator n=1 Tax=Demequina sp. NBRC 110053 TaxID=1570342 RepID=UPI000A06EAD7|nr:TetR/AcrR family transcriptional regulator [Demequina sp. NBRC 110053]
MTVDGRDARWTQHRADRRRELVSHALRAIRVHGAGVGMDAIAARAGTSKTVIYRHFGDREGLYDAVVESVHGYIESGLSAAFRLSDPTDLGTLTADLADAYLGLVERDPEIYRFVMTPPPQGADAVADPVRGLPGLIGEQIADEIERHLVERGLKPHAARTWGHGLVGFVKATADHWMASSPRPPRAEVVGHIAQFFAPARMDAHAPIPVPQEVTR